MQTLENQVILQYIYKGQIESLTQRSDDGD